MKINDETNLKDGNIEIKNGQIIYNFNSNKIISNEDALKLCYYFGVGMNGNHNNDKIQHRMVWEIFRDDFRGKYAEIIVRNDIIQNMTNTHYIMTDLDFKIEPQGKWDNTDLDVGIRNTKNYKCLSVKGVKKNSKNLLIEAERFKENGDYNYPNNSGEKIRVDTHVLVEVPIEKDFNKFIYKDSNGEFGTDNINGEFNNYEDMMKDKVITSNIYGGISHDEFWKIKAFAPKGIIFTVNNLKHIYKNKYKFNKNNIEAYKNLPDYYTKDGIKCFYEDGAIAHIREWDKKENRYKDKLKEVVANENYPVNLKKDNYFVPQYILKPLSDIISNENEVTQITMFD